MFKCSFFSSLGPLFINLYFMHDQYIDLNHKVMISFNRVADLDSLYFKCLARVRVDRDAPRVVAVQGRPVLQPDGHVGGLGEDEGGGGGGGGSVAKPIKVLYINSQ